jgi:hypothetical protein
MNYWAKTFDSPESIALINPVMIDGGLVRLPTEIGQETTGQYFDALTYQAKWRKQEESEEGITPSDTFALYEKIFRIYAYPSMSNGPYNAGKAMTMDISKTPFNAVIAWAYFFLTNQARLKDGTQTNAPKARTQTKKNRRVFRKFLNSLGFWQRSTN